VSGRPFYGYHARQHTFVKLYFYNPMMVKRAADLLAAGAVMNQVPRNFRKKILHFFFANVF
jgi:DNA polymerase zeta